jgi:hypothetical protein
MALYETVVAGSRVLLPAHATLGEQETCEIVKNLAATPAPRRGSRYSSGKGLFAPRRRHRIAISRIDPHTDMDSNTCLQYRRTPCHPNQQYHTGSGPRRLLVRSEREGGRGAISLGLWAECLIPFLAMKRSSLPQCILQWTKPAIPCTQGGGGGGGGGGGMGVGLTEEVCASAKHLINLLPPLPIWHSRCFTQCLGPFSCKRRRRSIARSLDFLLLIFFPLVFPPIGSRQNHPALR